MTKKDYIKPLVTRIALDNSISLVMMTKPPMPPMPMALVISSQGTPFASPFENDTFD